MMRWSGIRWLPVVLVVASWTACRRNDSATRTSPSAPSPNASDAESQSVQNSSGSGNNLTDTDSRDEQGSPGTATTERMNGATEELANDSPVRKQDDSRSGTADSANHGPVPNQTKTTVATPIAHSERVILFANRGPLLVELTISVDGLPMQEAMDMFLSERLNASDANKNGRTTWEELLAYDRIRAGGESELNDDRSAEDPTDRYDTRSDGLVSPDELLSYLSRDMRSSRLLQMAGSSYNRLRSHEESPVWDLLDDDLDGRLSPAETVSLGLRLRSRDYNNDDLLQLAEVRNGLENPPIALQLISSNQPEAVFSLHSRVDWTRIQAALEELYGRLITWHPDRFPITPNLIVQLDDDGDGIIRTDELKRFLSLSPHISILVELGKAKESGPLVQVQQPESEIIHRTENLVRNHLLISMSGLRLSIIAQDRFDIQANWNAANDFFSLHDGDMDGVLSKDEFSDTSPWGSFDDVASNETELSRAAWREHVRSRTKFEHRIVQARVGFQIDALFSYIDANDDQMLTAREMDAAPAKLGALDRDRDTRISADEIPEQMIIGIVRSRFAEADSVFASIHRRPAGDTKNDIPAWFSAMDANGDNEIGRTEFLGETKLFQQLDTNGDTYLQPNETKHFFKE